MTVSDCLREAQYLRATLERLSLNGELQPGERRDLETEIRYWERQADMRTKWVHDWNLSGDGE